MIVDVFEYPYVTITQVHFHSIYMGSRAYCLKCLSIFQFPHIALNSITAAYTKLTLHNLPLFKIQPDLDIRTQNQKYCALIAQFDQKIFPQGIGTQVPYIEIRLYLYLNKLCIAIRICCQIKETPRSTGLTHNPAHNYLTDSARSSVYM